MRVTSAIFMLEFPNNPVEGTGAPSVQEQLQAANEAESRTFVSLYSGKAGMGQADSSASWDRQAGTRRAARIAFRIEIRIDCTQEGFLDPDASN